MRRMPVSVLIIIAIASMIALALGLHSTAHAATGNRYMLKDLTRVQLTALVHDSLQRDPTGHAKLLPQICEHNRNACATPYDYFVSYQKLDPEAGLTDISQLEDYFSILVDGKAPSDGEYRMACLVPTAAPGMFVPNVDCSHRAFTKGEMVSYDPHTKRIVLAWDCKNPVGARWDVPVPSPPPCAYLPVDGKQNDTLREIVAIPQNGKLDESACPVGIKMPGSMEFVPLKDNCPDGRCSVIQYQAYTGKVTVRVGSEKFEQSGRAVIRVPAYFARPGELSEVDLCLKQSDDGITLGRQSCGQRIHAANYQLTTDNAASGGAPVMNAYLLYPGEPNTTGVPIVYWHWSDAYKCWVF